MKSKMKKVTKGFILGLLFALLCVLNPGNLEVFGGSNTVQAAAVSLSKTHVTLAYGDTFDVTLKNAKAKNIKWSVSNKSILCIEDTENGGNPATIWGMKVGTAKVYAKYAGKTYTCVVNVKYIPTLSTKYLWIEKGRSDVVTMSNTSATPKWSVANNRIATITKSGRGVRVKGVKKGTTYVYAVLNGKRYTCKVVVA